MGIASLLPLAALLPFVLGAAYVSNPDARAVIPYSYIVKYVDNVLPGHRNWHEAHIHLLAQAANASHGVSYKYSLHTFQAYHVMMVPSVLQTVLNSPMIEYVEKDQPVNIHDDLPTGLDDGQALKTQPNAPWGLARISHRARGATSYVYSNSPAPGAGVKAYVVDTGILLSHNEFAGGRAIPGTNFINTSVLPIDDNGHGTHCAGVIGGTTFGVAKMITVVAIKVLDSSGGGAMSTVIAGIDWAANDAKSNYGKSIISMSLGGSLSQSLNSAVNQASNLGITITVAAGNDGVDASNTSPASATGALAVGAIDNTDQRASFSNFGSKVKVFAPGVNIISAWIGSNSANFTLSGTSMATPHVAGTAAYLMQLNRLYGSTNTKARLLSLAHSGVGNKGAGSPDLILYNGSGA